MPTSRNCRLRGRGRELGRHPSDTVIATGHPNHDLAEFGLSSDRHAATFPVEPVDLADQARRIDHLLGIAVGAGASIVVLPELCVSEALARQLETWVRRPGPLRWTAVPVASCDVLRLGRRTNPWRIRMPNMADADDDRRQPMHETEGLQHELHRTPTTRRTYPPN